MARASIDQLLDQCRTYLPSDRLDVIGRAYDYAANAHNGQQRVSGDPYIEHPLSAAITVANLQLDSSAVAATLLHDVIEDCGVSGEEIGKEFGADVQSLVEGTTKLSRMQWRTPEERPGDDEVQAENL